MSELMMPLREAMALRLKITQLNTDTDQEVVGYPIFFDGGTVFATSGENAGHWTEGAPPNCEGCGKPATYEWRTSDLPIEAPDSYMVCECDECSDDQDGFVVTKVEAL